MPLHEAGNNKGKIMKKVPATIAAIISLSITTAVFAAGFPPAPTANVKPTNIRPISPFDSRKVAKPANKIIRTNTAKTARIQIRHPSTPYNP
jgi:hypothetical protein